VLAEPRELAKLRVGVYGVVGYPSEVADGTALFGLGIEVVDVLLLDKLFMLPDKFVEVFLRKGEHGSDTGGG
jgi:hypothetical protein